MLVLILFKDVSDYEKMMAAKNECKLLSSLSFGIIMYFLKIYLTFFFSLLGRTSEVLCTFSDLN